MHLGMTTRREILKTGATAMALTSLSHRAFGLAAADDEISLPFDTVVVDERIGGSKVLSRVARASGMECVAIRGDLTRLWFDSLRGACLDRSTVVAGFTSDLDRQELWFDITFNVETGRETIRRSMDPSLPPEFALSGKPENLLDYYMTLLVQARERSAPVQFTAWVIAPIRD